MHPFMTVVHQSLVLPRSCNRSDSSVYKTKTVLKWCTSCRHCICITLKSLGIHNTGIPLSQSMSMMIKYKIHYGVGDHADLWDRQTEYAFPSERPELVVFLCFTHLAVAIRPQCSLERVSSLLGKPGSCTMKLLQHLCPLPRTPIPASGC